MKSNIISMRILFLFVLLIVSGGCIGDTGEQLGDAFVEIARIVCFLVEALTLMTGAIAVLLLVIAGLKWIGSSDNPQERNQAKKMAEAVIIGVLIVVLSITLVKAIIHETTFRCDASVTTVLTPGLR
ncbi:MAG: hypothetical protein ABH851_02390 [Methanobacteriota archaeon]